MRSTAALSAALCLLAPTLSLAQAPAPPPPSTILSTSTCTVTRTLQRVVATTTIVSSSPPPQTTPLYIIPQNTTRLNTTTVIVPSTGYTLPTANATTYVPPAITSTPVQTTLPTGAAVRNLAGWGSALGGLAVAVGVGLL